ncbi:hypothetical protein Tco_0751299 [Tanacetum coccineum]|uniref:Uncharacterized protein n=1 Tax=Tanacetum coccineum TaxID=301880 RepID=A0ABQ4Z7B0_9ASTR
MSTSTTHQQSLADAGSMTRPLMLERGSYIPWASRFRRYLNQKRENRKWLNKAINEGPHVFKNFTPEDSQTPRLQTEDDLTGDDLKHYEAKIEAMNLILNSILDDIYNSVDASTTTQATWQTIKRLMRGTMQNKANRETRFNNKFDQFITEPAEALVSVYNRCDQLMNDLERNRIKFPKVTVNTKFLNCLQPKWLKYVTQVRLTKRENKLEKSYDPLTLVAHTGSSSRIPAPYYVTHPSSVVDYDDDYQGDVFQNNFEDPLISAMIRSSGNDGRNIRRSFIPEEIIEGPRYDSKFLSEVQKPSTSYVNPLFAKDNQEQKYLNQPKIINDTNSDDQIGSNIIFDEPNVDVNSGSVEYDNNVQASYELEKLARNAYKEAEKQQINANKLKQQNKILTQQLNLYKEKVRVFEMTKGDNTTFLNEFIEVDSKARRLEKDLQNQFIRDRDMVRDLEQKRDNLQLYVVKLKRKIVELQKTQTILKQKMSENEHKYPDTVLDLEARAKENENMVLKISRSLQGMFMLGLKPMSFYDPNVKHNLGDMEDILDDATKSQKKIDKKCMDPIAIEKKQNVHTIDYNKLNALYEDFVPQKELSAEQKYFSSTFIPFENSSNANTSTSPSETKPPVASMPSSNPMKLYLEQMENEFKKLFALLQTNSKRESIFYQLQKKYS